MDLREGQIVNKVGHAWTLGMDTYIYNIFSETSMDLRHGQIVDKVGQTGTSGRDK